MKELLAMQIMWWQFVTTIPAVQAYYLSPFWPKGSARDE